MRQILAIAAAMLLAIMLVLPVGAQQAAVDVKDNAFDPASITVAAGTTVTWTHRGQNPHSVTADDNSFDSNPQCPGVIAACMQAGQTFQKQFTQPGTVTYKCKVHPAQMTGSVVVQAAATPTPAATTAPPPARATTAPPRTTAPAAATTARPTPTPKATPTPTAAPTPTPTETPLATFAAEPEAKKDNGTPALNILAIALGAAAVVGAGIAAAMSYLRRTRA